MALRSNIARLGSSNKSLYQTIADQEKEATQANKARETEIRNLFGANISTYETGGKFLQAGYADIANQAQRLVGQETQNLISGGLYGTTVASSIPTRVASSFTAPARLKLEDIAEQRLTSARSDLASFINSITNEYPDYNALLEAIRAQSSVPTQTINSTPSLWSQQGLLSPTASPTPQQPFDFNAVQAKKKTDLEAWNKKYGF